MHELSIAQNILEIVQRNLPPPPTPHIRCVRLRVGDMAGVVTDSLEFCFSAIITGTELEGAHLEIERVPVVAQCKTCSHKFSVEQFVFACARCTSPQIELISGRELHVVEVELFEKEDPVEAS